MPEPLAVEAVAALRARGLTVAVAESLTGGLLASALVDVPGASAVFRGGVVAYATDLKASLLGVDLELLDAEGPVHPSVAEQMAAGVRLRAGADIGLATTGVAGPESQGGHPPGTVYLGIAGPDVAESRLLRAQGDRRAIRSAAVSESLAELLRMLATAAE